MRSTTVSKSSFLGICSFQTRTTVELLARLERMFQPDRLVKVVSLCKSLIDKKAGWIQRRRMVRCPAWVFSEGAIPEACACYFLDSNFASLSRIGMSGSCLHLSAVRGSRSDFGPLKVR
jgi:hypothetical protein